MGSEMFTPVVHGIIYVLLTTLMARAIRHLKCLSALPALRPAIKAAVEATKKTTGWAAAVAVGAASAKGSAGNNADADFSARLSLPRIVKRRHAKEREKKENALERSNSNPSNTCSSEQNVANVSPAIAVCASKTPSATANGPPPQNHLPPQLTDDDEACTFPVYYFVNLQVLLYSDNSKAWPKSIVDNENHPVKSTSLEPPHGTAQTPPASKPTTTLALLSIKAHNEDKGLSRFLEVSVWPTGILNYGGVKGSPSAGEEQWLLSGAGKGGGRSRSNNRKGADKRKRDHRDGRDGNGDKKRGRPGPYHRNDDEDEWDGRFLACPYYKMDPHRYSRCWAKYELKRFADVKQHLIRCHKVKEYYCSQCCLVEFEDHADWQAHSQTCNVLNPASGPENFTTDEIRRLANAPRGATNEMKYFWVWDNFFSNWPRPESPYVQDYLSETRAVHGRDLAGAVQAVLGGVEPLREGEDRGAWMARIAGLSPGILEHMSQAEHPWRLRHPPSAVVAAHAHAQANQQAASPQIQQPQQPQAVPVAPALGHVPSGNGQLPPVAHALQGTPSPSPHALPLQHRPQRLASARPAPAGPSAMAVAQASSSIRGGVVGMPPPPPPPPQTVMNMDMMNMMNPNYQGSLSRAQYRQGSLYPPSPHPPTPRPSALPQGEVDIPIDPNLHLEYTPPPRPQLAPPAPHNSNIPDQPTEFLQDDDEFDIFEWIKNNP